MKKLTLFVVILFAFISSTKKEQPIYKDAKQPIEVRVKDLLARMTLEEKVAQTECIWGQKKLIFNASGDFDEQKADSVLKNGLGEIARVNEKFKDGNGIASLNAKDMALLSNKIQKFFIEKTRLGIPVIFHEESLHGNQAKDATCFPSPLAMASAWNPELMTEVYTHIAEEVRCRGAHHVLAPVVDVLHDPRWGRSEETLGEDPYLISQLAVAEVNAYQGNSNTIDKKHVAATLKHFGVHGAPEGGVNVSPSFVDERTLREVYFPPFKACVQEGKVESVMPCYAEIAGIPDHSNKRILDDILRKEWGFKGVIVSDYYGIYELHKLHKVAQNLEEAAMLAIDAGVTIEAPERVVYPSLTKIFKEGKLPMHVLDSSVVRMLRLKFKLGLFDNPYVDPIEAEKIVGNSAKRAIALKAAQQSIILLKNENNILPLNKKGLKKIAVIGPNANRCILGGYSDEPKQLVTPLDAIKQKVGNDVEIIYSEGCKITDKGNWFDDTVVLANKTENLKRIAQAVEAAKNADVILLFVGGNEATAREAWGKNHMGDATNLELIGEQNELVKQIMELKKPTAAFISSGPPLAFAYVSQHVPAIVQCWYLGQETGTAIADVLFGDVNPSGKLPVSIARSAGHIPCYYNYKPSARRGYLFDDVKPLYPFGFGLSYTTFKYDHLKLSDSIAANKENLKIEATIEVTNTGAKAGDEIVQLYIRDKFSSVTRPVKELKGFKRVSLLPGEKKTVSFTITKDDLSFYNLKMDYVVEPGDFEIMVGASCINTQSVNLHIN